MSKSVRDWIKSLDLSPRPVTSGSTRRRISASRARQRSTRFLRGHTWDTYDNKFNLGVIMENSENKIFLGVSDTEDLIKSELLTKRVATNKATVQRETTVLCNRQNWATWAETYFKEFLYVQTVSSAGLIIEQDELNFINFSVNSSSTTVRAFGDADFCDYIITLVEGEFSVVTSYIEWVYNSDGSSVNVPLNRERLPVDEMYPFLKGETLGSYYDRYMKSSANILLLIGPPGTGKTSFIRGLLAHTDSSAIVSYDSAILDKDGFFARFIEDDANIMVLEDSDAFLKSRTDGNTMMHRFLNVGDGLVTTKGKKMIFSTNLPSIRDIDSALIRPGRCFDIVTFDNLTVPEAHTLAEKLGTVLPVRERGKETSKYSIAEVFHEQINAPAATSNRKVGFI